jgi:hypothetical protein
MGFLRRKGTTQSYIEEKNTERANRGLNRGQNGQNTDFSNISGTCVLTPIPSIPSIPSFFTRCLSSQLCVSRLVSRRRIKNRGNRGLSLVCCFFGYTMSQEEELSYLPDDSNL